MIRTRCLPASLLTLALSWQAPAVLAQAKLPPETLIRGQDFLRVLGFELTLLESDVLPTLAPDQRADLGRRVARLQLSVQALERALTPGAGPALVFKRYADVDRDLHDLVDAINFSRLPTAPLKHSAKRIAFADTQLSAIFARDGGDGAWPIALKRQAQALAAATSDLNELVRIVVPGALVGQRVRAAARALDDEAGDFNAFLDPLDPRDLIRKRYRSVDAAWHRLAVEINALPDALAKRLVLAARGVDLAHERLAHMLDLDDAPPYIIDEEEAIRQRVALFQGTWTIVSTEQNGMKVGGPDKANRFIFRGNRWFREERGRLTANGTFRITELGPAFTKVEMTHATAAVAGLTVPARMDFKGDLMFHAYRADALGYPPSFATRPGDGVLSIVWRKE